MPNVETAILLEGTVGRVISSDSQGKWDLSFDLAVCLLKEEPSTVSIVHRTSRAQEISSPLSVVQVSELPGGLLLLSFPEAAASGSRVYAFRPSVQDRQHLDRAQQGANGARQKTSSGGRVSVLETGKAHANGPGKHFSSKTESGSADLYFHYYGMLQHQQNMLQDYIRTATYHQAITDNPADFGGKLVMDVGAGTGILSLFAAQAGAARVYAVEASAMAGYARQLAAANKELGSKVQVVAGKVEELQGLPQVDVLVSEPMGTLLVNERMLETYLYARDHYLKPGGRMYPNLGRVHVAAFSDEELHAEMVAKAQFWLQDAYFGLDLTSLHSPAMAGYFQQVVVDAVHPQCLVSTCATREFDFQSVQEHELHDITIPLDLAVSYACSVHGVACWFDVAFQGSQVERWLSTAPGYPTTHWFQLRCVLMTPLVVGAGQSVQGSLRLVAHNQQSYDVHLTLTAPPLQPGQPPQQASGKLDLKEPFYRQLLQWPAETQQAWPQQEAAAVDQTAVQLPISALEAGLSPHQGGAQAAGQQAPLSQAAGHPASLAQGFAVL